MPVKTAKRTRTPMTKATPSSKKSKGEKKTKIKTDIVTDLAQAISGKDGVVDVLRFSSDDVVGHVTGVISTGSIAVDKATGIGGLPRGRLVEVYGKEQVGKTTFMQHVIANCQKMGGVAGLYEPEDKWDLTYATAPDVGVDADKLLAIQPGAKTIEEGIAAFDRALTHWIDRELWEIPLVLVWDSIGGTSHEKEYADVNNKEPGIPARALRKAMRVLTGKIARARALVLVANQTYEKIGFTGFGAKSSTYGGGGIRYHASMRIELKYTGQLKLPSGVPIGIEGLARIYKNSLGIPRDEAYAIAYRRGFDNSWALFDKLKEQKFITSGGGQYTFAAQGQEPLKWTGGFAELDQMMRADPTIRTRLMAVYDALP